MEILGCSHVHNCREELEIAISEEKVKECWGDLLKVVLSENCSRWDWEGWNCTCNLNVWFFFIYTVFDCQKCKYEASQTFQFPMLRVWMKWIRRASIRLRLQTLQYWEYVWSGFGEPRLDFDSKPKQLGVTCQVCEAVLELVVKVGKNQLCLYHWPSKSDWWLR